MNKIGLRFRDLVYLNIRKHDAKQLIVAKDLVPMVPPLYLLRHTTRHIKQTLYTPHVHCIVHVPFHLILTLNPKPQIVSSFAMAQICLHPETRVRLESEKQRLACGAGSYGLRAWGFKVQGFGLGFQALGLRI